MAEDQSYAYDVDAVDPDNDILAYGLDTAPASAVIDAANGLIGWTPDPAFAQSVRAFNAQCYVVPEGVEQDGDEPGDDERDRHHREEREGVFAG